MTTEPIRNHSSRRATTSRAHGFSGPRVPAARLVRHTSLSGYVNPASRPLRTRTRSFSAAGPGAGGRTGGTTPEQPDIWTVFEFEADEAAADDLARAFAGALN